MELIHPDDGSSFGTRTVIGHPAWFSDTPVAAVPPQAPALAEHTEAVLVGLGMSKAQVEDLVADSVVARAKL